MSRAKTVMDLMKYWLDILLWIMIVVWCAVIFMLSAEDDVESGGRSEKVCRFTAETFVSDFEQKPPVEQNEIVEGMQFYVRKTAHFSAYCLLGALLCLAFRRLPVGKRAIISQLLTTAYAAADETHQLFVSGRSGSPLDVLLDSCGGLAGIMIGLLVWLAVSKLLRKASGKAAQ